MKALIVRLLQSSFIRFAMVGVANTALGAALMFLFYNFMQLGYWGSSALSYVLASIFSFFANRSFTFGNKAPILHTLPKFALNVAVCYVLAYLIAKPVVYAVFAEGMPFFAHREQIAMYAGMVFFTLLNYVGQRLLVFAGRTKS